MINFEEVKSEVIGKWPGIFQQLGIDVGNGKHRACPVCAGKDRFRFDDKEGRGTWYCNQCGAGDGWKLVQNVLGIGFKAAVEQVAPILGKVGAVPSQSDDKTLDPGVLRKIFKESEPASRDNLVGQYLQSRGLKVVPEPLRYHSKCWNSDVKKSLPAMIAVVHSPTREGVTLHRTYLDVVSAGKADVPSPKKLMPRKTGCQDLHGSAIRLFEPEERALGIAEGIETAIACYERFCIPTWAVISSALMKSFTPPAGVDKVYIFGDNDKHFGGQIAAYSLADRLKRELGYEYVYVYIPENIGDWLDEKALW